MSVTKKPPTAQRVERNIPEVTFGLEKRDSKSMPVEIAVARDAAWQAILQLYRFTLRNNNQSAFAVEQLIEIGCLSANLLEGLWTRSDQKALLLSFASQRVDFPLLKTGPKVLGHLKRKEMYASIVLAGSAQWQKGKGDEDDLKRELLWFFLGVYNPDSLRTNDGKDAIDEVTRSKLCGSPETKKLKDWTNAFKVYVKAYRSNLLSADGMTGRFADLAKNKMQTFKLKSPQSAFFRFVRDQFRPLLKNSKPKSSKQEG